MSVKMKKDEYERSKTPKKPLLYYYTVAMILVMLFNFLAMP